ncbi:MAG TPA: serine hydrolase domain-containing protein, partial [Armatimonadota bacterium]|nr:serine hydrolase domain-containing protein [Armatimonadota bacterium]
MNSDAFPGADWRRSETSEHALSGARAWLDSHGSEARYRVVVIQSGKLVAEWNQNADSDDHLGLASAAKSVFSCMLAVAVDEGRVDSPDAKVVDYYPEMMDVPEGAGPKPGRYAFEKDPEITFRQLISNTSGYMKPNENPGTVYHYQTYGMNILTHAIAKVYGHYDPADVDGSPGLQPLVDEKLRDPIGASWSYYRMNFDLHAAARTGIFGNYDGIQSTALDMARLGWLWCNWGRWGNRQIVPGDWLREAAQTAPTIREHCPPEQ